MKSIRVLMGLFCATVATCLLLAPVLASASTAEIERGRYVVKIGGCNDCHTAGYAEAGGAIAESQWLTGVPVGYKGPWGVTYPANLRLLVRNLTEDQWVRELQVPRRPPMPWFGVKAMSEGDQRAMYQYIRSLGPAGSAAPAYVAPGASVSTPYILFVPQPPPPDRRASN